MSSSYSLYHNKPHNGRQNEFYDAIIPVTPRHDTLLKVGTCLERTVFAGYTAMENGQPGPAEICQLIRHPGDAIVRINNVDCRTKTFLEILKMLEHASAGKYVLIRFQDKYLKQARERSSRGSNTTTTHESLPPQDENAFLPDTLPWLYKERQAWDSERQLMEAEVLRLRQEGTSHKLRLRELERQLEQARRALQRAKSSPRLSTFGRANATISDVRNPWSHQKMGQLDTTNNLVLVEKSPDAPTNSSNSDEKGSGEPKNKPEGSDHSHESSSNTNNNDPEVEVVLMQEPIKSPYRLVMGRSKADNVPPPHMAPIASHGSQDSSDKSLSSPSKKSKEKHKKNSNRGKPKHALPAESQQWCQGVTAKGEPCRRIPAEGATYCWFHRTEEDENEKDDPKEESGSSGKKRPRRSLSPVPPSSSTPNKNSSNNSNSKPQSNDGIRRTTNSISAALDSEPSTSLLESIAALKNEESAINKLRKTSFVDANGRPKKYPVGTKVKKYFPKHGWFCGFVERLEHDRYHVVYEDGDEEDFLFKEQFLLDDIVCKDDSSFEHSKPPGSKKPKRHRLLLSETADTKVAADESSDDSDDDDEAVDLNWVQCARCRKWRVLLDCLDESPEKKRALPKQWFCAMNRHDAKNKSCKSPERSEEWYEAEIKRRKG